jgi:hypothetical protein
MIRTDRWTCFSADDAMCSPPVIKSDHIYGFHLMPEVDLNQLRFLLATYGSGDLLCHSSELDTTSCDSTTNGDHQVIISLS